MKKDTVDQLRIRTMLPRVEDLEHSVQWISLANDIDDLERLRHRGRPVLRREKRGAIAERHTYQRASMPEMQRACTIRCDDDRTVDHLDEPRNSRWSWKPRTDFEREYFYKDYKDYYYGDPDKPPSFDEPPRETRERPAESPRPSTRYAAAGLEREHYSDSRERLHEIFEHNRYLRRQFFAEAPAGARQDSRAGFTRSLGRSSQDASRRYTGFGSTETLTSQSNQSSVSSVNDRKSARGRTTRSPEEEEEEEDVLTELVGKSDVVAPSRAQGRKNEARRDVKVLVNILPGSEIQRVENAARRMHDKSFQCDETDRDDARRRERKPIPEYIFGGGGAGADLRTRAERKRFSEHGTRTSGSLPNLTVARRNLDEPLYVARAVNVPGEERRIEGTRSTRSIGRGQSAATADERLTPRSSGVKARTPPPPLDLSAVNERCERMEAAEKRRLNDYSVDVAILRSHEDLVEDMLAGGSERAIKDVVVGSVQPPRKSCDLSLIDELQSPQLVNNCKSDPRPVAPIETSSRCRIDAGRRDRATSPLFDPIGGPHAAGSALPSTVYGPIPYSQ